MKKNLKTLKDRYQYIGILPSSVRIKENGFWGMNDFEGNEILPSNYIEIFTLSSGYGLIAARDAGNWDIYDYEGNKLNLQKYDNIYPYYGFFGMSKVKSQGKWGIINKFGEIIIPIEYHRIEKFGKGLSLYMEGSIEFLDRKELIKLTSVKAYDYKQVVKRSIPKRIIGINTKKTPAT